MKLKNYENKIVTGMAAVALTVALESAARADAISTALDNLQSWLSTVIGGSLIVIGLCIAGFRMLNGDERAWENVKPVIIGGLIISLAKPLMLIIRGWTGQ